MLSFVLPMPAYLLQVLWPKQYLPSWSSRSYKRSRWFQKCHILKTVNFTCFLTIKKWSLLNLPSATFSRGWQCQVKPLKGWGVLKILPSISAVFVIADMQSFEVVSKVWTAFKSWHNHYKPFNFPDLLFLLIFFIKIAKGS